jgi:hypothetical protein
MFKDVARINAKALGLPQLPILSVPHPLGGITKEEAISKAEKSIDEFLKITDFQNSIEKTEEDVIPEIIQVKDSSVDISKLYYDNGWTDGLPIIPPTSELIQSMLTGTKHSPNEIIGKLAPQAGIATVEKIAINAVMAGCQPNYLPVLLAAVEAISEPASNMKAWASTTGPNSPLLIINGDIREELNINCGTNALGIGRMANAAIGRAISLIVRNIGGAKPGITDMTTIGAGWEFSNCAGENEQSLPRSWPPFNIEVGHPGESTVTVKSVSSQIDVFHHVTSEFKQILDTIAAGVVGINNFGMIKGHGLIIFFNPEAAVLADKDLWSKEKIREYIFEKARQPLKTWKKLGDNIMHSEMLPEAGKVSEEYMMPMLSSLEDIIIFVVGGAGKHSTWWSGGQGKAVTRSIDKWR